ncbi:hypothetical protein MJ575_04795 [Klebsiella pneumoniae]|nr:hypothetical protein MJ575_04795 [Klebsiella pneumoniae]
MAKAEKPAASGVYTVEVEGKALGLKSADGGDVRQLMVVAFPAPHPPLPPRPAPVLPVTACWRHYLEGAGQRRPDGGRRRGAADFWKP